MIPLMEAVSIILVLPAMFNYMELHVTYDIKMFRNW